MGSITRTLSFFSKWLAEVFRQPSLLLTLVVGPFLLLLAFGEAVKLGAPPPRTILVTPVNAEPGRIMPIAGELNEYLDVVEQTTDLDAARRRLRVGDVQLVLVLPPDPLAEVEAGRHARIQVFTSEIDPVRRSYARTFIREQVAYVNQQTLNKAIGDAQASAGEVDERVDRARDAVRLLRSVQGDVGRARQALADLRTALGPIAAAANSAAAAAQGISFVVPGRASDSEAARLARAASSLGRTVESIEGRLVSGSGAGALPSDAELASIEQDLDEIDRTVGSARTIPSEVLSAPFELELQNIAALVPDYIDFYAPAVLALLIQHLAITLGALSMSRLRLLGVMEVLRVSPVRPGEVVTGNYLSYGALCAVAAAVLVGLLTFGLGVPVAGSWVALIGMVGLLILCSLGIGFAVSMLASSEQQAAQIAMLVLIGSVFFSGFIVPRDTLALPFSGISYLFPSTYAIRSLQDVMLRGIIRERFELAVLGPVAPYADFVILALAAVLLFVLTVRLLRREFRPT